MAHVIGLTGGIASGKTTVARLLAARGAAVVDADRVAREIVEPGQPALAELVARFGAAILAADGTLDRKRLAATAFADPNARADLNRITHPRIAAASARQIAAWADAGADVVFYEAALLVENRAHAGLADLIVVAASAEEQERRLIERDQLAPVDAHARIAAQLPLADKIAVATWVIWNDAGDAALAAAVDDVVRQIEARYAPIRAPRDPHALGRAVDRALARRPRGRARHRLAGVHRAANDRQAHRCGARHQAVRARARASSPPPRRPRSPLTPTPRCWSATSATWTSGSPASSTARSPRR